VDVIAIIKEWNARKNFLSRELMYKWLHYLMMTWLPPVVEHGQGFVSSGDSTFHSGRFDRYLEIRIQIQLNSRNSLVLVGLAWIKMMGYEVN